MADLVACSAPLNPKIVMSVAASSCPTCPASRANLCMELTSQCTDQCVVVACNDPDHDNPVYTPETQYTCPDGTSCTHAATECTDCNFLEHFQQCCHSDVHDHHQSVSWDPTLEAFFCSCGVGFAQEDGSVNFMPYPAEQQHHAYYTQSEYPPPQPPLSYVPEPEPVQQADPPIHLAPFPCQWAECHAAFDSMVELVGHVNLHHLRLPVIPEAQPDVLPPSETQSTSCLWRECHDFHSPNMIPGSSSGNVDNTLNILASHLLRDHLGFDFRIPTPPPLYEQTSISSDITALLEPKAADTTVATPASSSSEPSTPPMPAHRHTCSGTHICRWISCGQVFSSCDELTEHLNTAHVGSGKAHYDCFWEGCKRNGDQGFTSKQKICRHLQSHSGHRPFNCSICNQNFSEAATLQQHMRRHTQERPYVCDYPGCGKSFAITGALTIHKRIHNGEKPFKCTYCDKAFAESSNLSKHLRTHTGARPYLCTFPGCGKSFARPDQLNRHQSVHTKKVASNSSSS